MATYKTKGIILKRKDFGEADKLITVYTDTEGKIKSKAKGIRWLLSKNKGHLELFTYSELIFAQGKEIDTLASAYTIESFKNIKDNLKKTALAYYFCELVDKLIAEKEKNKKIFDLLLENFRYLGKDAQKETLTRYFELNLLTYLGYKPEVNLCVHCRKKLEAIFNFFSCKLGGIICPACCLKYDPKSSKISPNGIKILRTLLSYNLETALKIKIDSKTEKEVKKIVENFLRYIAEKEFKSLKFISSVNEKKGSPTNVGGSYQGDQ